MTYRELINHIKSFTKYNPDVLDQDVSIFVRTDLFEEVMPIQEVGLAVNFEPDITDIVESDQLIIAV